MKSAGYLLISLLALCATTQAWACWVPTYTPDTYYMYRVYDKNLHSGRVSLKDRNCEEWQRLTSMNIPVEDIYEVVYEMPLEEYMIMYDNPTLNYDNKFAQWITKRDKAILDFLLLAKNNEYIRFRINSRWYYPTMNIGAQMTLEEIVEKSLAVNDKRLRERYLLQAIRALFTLHRYDECVKIWEEEVLPLPNDNLMKLHIRDYIAGALCHVGSSPKSTQYFAEIGYINSILYSVGRDREMLTEVEELELVCEYAPNSDYIPSTLAEIVRRSEASLDDYFFSPKPAEGELSHLYRLCLKMAQDKRTENKAMWYYTAAFISDFEGDAQNASYLLSRAEASRSTPFIDESIAVFRIYLDAKLSTYNAAYEKKLYGQLQWLDEKIANNIDDKVRQTVMSEYKLGVCESFYYWNDMLRRILLAEVAPRMIEAGKPVRALQLVNMADNYLYNLVDCIDRYETVVIGDSIYRVTRTMQEHRYSESKNYLDYSNYFFATIDTLGVDVAKAYVDNIEHSTRSFDLFLNERGYTGRDYLYDIVGTQCMRQMRYGEAVSYLGKVGADYVHHSNVYMTRNPFAAEPEVIPYTKEFKYDFAREMYSLEQSIQVTTDPNRKAQLMMKYALGLRNSFDWSWALTQYYRNWQYECSGAYDWEKSEYALTAKAQSLNMIDAACKMVTNDEIAAAMQYELRNYLTVATMYPNTTYGQLVKGSCDNLEDYHAETYNRRDAN